MSKHFFYGFCLTILFVSTNLWSMHNRQLSTKYVYSRNATKKNLHQNKPLSLSSLSSMPYFKRQSVALQNNDANQYSLIFNHNQQPCITEYLIDDKYVGKLMQIGDDINFAHDNSTTCHFSLQIPYQAGSLTINTQGQCIFEKKIGVCSAYLAGKAITFSDAFFSNNGLIVESDDCKSHDQLTSSDFLFKGNSFEIMPESSLSTHNSLTLTAQSLLLNRGVIDSKKESLITSPLFQNSGTLASHNMGFNGDKIINQGTLAIGDTFHCASRLFENSGIVDVFNNCIMEKGDIFSSTPSSLWNVNGDWKSSIASFYLQGSFSIKDLYLTGKNFTSESPIHCIAENAYLQLEEDMTNAGVIKILGLLDVDSKNINLKKTSCVMVDNADLKINQAIENKGTFSVKKHLSAHSHTISNKGKIETDSSSIKADRYYYNSILSVFSAKNNLTINTPLSLNLFGLTHAQHFMINSAIDFNALGIYAAKNMNVNSLLVLNAGCLLPKFSTFSETCSWQNLRGLSESLFIKHVPVWGTIYALVKNVQGVYLQGKTLCSEVRSSYGQKNIGASDKIALICSIKSMLGSVKQTFQLGNQSYNLLSNSPPVANPENIETAPDVATKAKNVAQHLASAMVSHYGPSVNKNSLVDLNYGPAIGVNSHSSSLYSHNADVSLYLNNTIDTRYGKNTGHLGAYNLNINATSSYDSDNSIGVSNGNIETDYLTIKGPLNALKDVRLQGKSSACIKGDVTGQKIAIKSDRYLNIHSHLNSPNTHLHAKEISQYGVMTGQQLIMTGDRITNYGTLKSAELIINKAHLPKLYWLDKNPSFFHNKGSLLASDLLSVDAGDIHLYEQSQISAPNAHFKSDGEWYNSGKIDAKQLGIDAQRDITNCGSLQAATMFITQAKLDNNSWGASGRAFYNHGNLQVLEQLSVDAQNIRLGKESQVSGPNIYLKSNGEWQNNGNMNADLVILDAQKDMTNNGFLKARKAIITHSGPDCNRWRKKHFHFLNQKSLQISEQLFVDAKAIHLTEQSQIDANNAYLKSNSNVRIDGILKTKQCVVESKGNVISNGGIDASQFFHATGQNVWFQEQSNLKAKHVSVDAKEKVINNGGIDALESFHAKGKNVSFQKQSNIKAKNASVDAEEDVINNGAIDASESFHATGKNISFQKQSNVKTKDAHYKASKNIILDGVTDVENGTVDAGGKVTAIGKIGASNQLGIEAKNISIEKTSDVLAHKANLKATETINNRGKLLTSDLLAHAKYVENSGKITADNRAHIKADRLFWNQGLGSINVENDLTIDSFISLNSLGYIRADSILTHAIIDLNLGIYQGHNVCQHSIFGWNAGAVIPKFKSSHYLQELFTWNNCGKLLTSLGKQSFPQLAMVCSLGTSIAFCYALSQQIKPLSEKKDLCVSDVVPVICEAKSALTSVIQTGSQACESALDSWNTWNNKPKQSPWGQQIYVGGHDAYQSAKDCLNSNFEQKSENTPVPTFSTVASIAGPQLSRNSLFDCNSGVMLGVNGNSQSLYNVNSGASLFANNYSLSTISGSNTGLIGAGDISINASQSYVSDGLLLAANLAMVANNLEVTGNAYASNHMLLKAHRDLKIDRELKARELAIRAKNIHIGEDASIVSQDKTNIIATQTVINKGTIDGKQTTVQGRKIILDNGSTISAHGSDSSAEVKATQVLGMHEGAEIHSEGKTNVHSNGYAKIDGSVTGKETSVQANTIDIQENAYLSSTSQTHVIAEQKLTNKGTIDGNTTVVQGNEVILDNGSKVLTHGSHGAAIINATTLDLRDNSHIDANTAFITAQSIHGEEGNRITSVNGTLMTTSGLDNSGTTTGPATLAFTGQADQLKSIGSVDQLTYSGTLENSLADLLVNGHNELLNVNKGGAITIYADQKDVHLKEEHNLSHTLCVQTQGSIQSDKDLSSENSILLQAKGDIQHASVKSKKLTALIGKNISSEGHVIPKSSGENYKDKCKESNVSGEQIILHAQENVNYKGTHVHSGAGGTQAFIGGRLIADALELQEYNKTETLEPGWCRWSKPIETTTEDHLTTSVPCTFSSDGVTRIVAGNAAELHSTMFASKGGTIIQGHIEQIPTYDRHIQIKEIKQGDKILEHTKSISRKENPIRFNDGESPVIISDQPTSLSLECNTPSITINAPAVELLAAKEETIKVCQKDKTYLGLWNRGPHEETHDTRYNPSYSGTINTTAQSIRIENTKNNIPAIVNSACDNASITRSLMEDIHTHQKQTLYSRPTKFGMGIIALSISIAMQALGPVVGAGIAKIGMESAVLSAMTTQATLGGMNALCQEAANTFLHCNGDYKEAAKKLASKQTVRNIAIAVATAVTTAGANQLVDNVVPPLSHANTFKNRCLSTAPRKLIDGSIRCVGDIAQGKKPKEAAKHRVRETAANILGAVCSSQIGQTYGDEKIGPVTHKILHTGLGAIEGAIIDGKNGAVAGAIGAGVAETVADIASPKPPSLDDIHRLEARLGRCLTQDEFASAWDKQTLQYLKKTQSVADGSKMIATTVAMLANQDMNIASETAAKAVDNNFIVLAMYGITGLSTAYSAYQIHKIYEQEGAVEALKHLGIEIACNAACLGASRVAFRVGGKLYPSARIAINTALDGVPGLKLVLGNAAESLITAAEKFVGTTAGKQIARANQYIKPLETHLINFENKIADKVGNVTKQVVDKAIKATDKVAGKVGKHLNPSFGEDLVEHVVPGPVLNQIEKQLAGKAAKEGAKQLAIPAPDKILLLPAPVASKMTKETTSVLTQDVSLSMKEIAQQAIAEKSAKLSVLEKDVERWSKEVSHNHVGEILNMDTDYAKFEKIETETKKFYDFMRSTNEDINAIAKNTGINKEILNQIKNHVFIEDHILRNNIITQFHPHEDMAAAWKRLMDGNFVYSDLILLQHEYAESFIMQGDKIPYDIAHEIVNKAYNWEKSYK